MKIDHYQIRFIVNTSIFPSFSHFSHFGEETPTPDRARVVTTCAWIINILFERQASCSMRQGWVWSDSFINAHDIAKKLTPLKASLISKNFNFRYFDIFFSPFSKSVDQPRKKSILPWLFPVSLMDCNVIVLIDQFWFSGNSYNDSQHHDRS